MQITRSPNNFSTFRHLLGIDFCAIKTHADIKPTLPYSCSKQQRPRQALEILISRGYGEKHFQVVFYSAKLNCLPTQSQVRKDP